METINVAEKATTPKELLKDKSIVETAKERGFKTMGEVYKYFASKEMKTIKSNTPSNHSYPSTFIFRDRVDLYSSTESVVGSRQVAHMAGDPMNPAINITIANSAIYLSEIALVVENKTRLEAKIKEVKKNLTELENKLKLVVSLDLEEYDDNLLNVVDAMSILGDIKPKDKLKLAESLVTILAK